MRKLLEDDPPVTEVATPPGPATETEGPAAPSEELLGFAAIRLFDERARAIRADFAVGSENAG